jgi:hypothetical protein
MQAHPEDDICWICRCKVPGRCFNCMYPEGTMPEVCNIRQLACGLKLHDHCLTCFEIRHTGQSATGEKCMWHDDHDRHSRLASDYSLLEQSIPAEVSHEKICSHCRTL